MKIVLATKNDSEHISIISKELIEYGLKQRYTESRINNLIDSESKNVAVAKTKDTIHGFGVMSYFEETANLDLLAVLPEYQRKGIASKIVSWLELVAVNSGLQWVNVQLRESNSTVLSFYQKLGYDEFSREVQVYGNETQIKMVKKIGLK